MYTIKSYFGRAHGCYDIMEGCQMCIFNPNYFNSLQSTKHLQKDIRILYGQKKKKEKGLVYLALGFNEAVDYKIQNKLRLCSCFQNLRNLQIMRKILQHLQLGVKKLQDI